MKLEFAVRKVETFEIRTPIGPKRIVIHTKVDTVEDEVPDEIATEIKDVPDFNDLDVIIEGVGVVLVSAQNGQRFPQPVQFRFPDDVNTKEDAFARFDECMRAEIERQQEEERKSEQSIQTANEMDLEALNSLLGENGIITP